MKNEDLRSLIERLEAVLHVVGGLKSSRDLLGRCGKLNMSKHNSGMSAAKPNNMWKSGLTKTSKSKK
jgi:hypothetical protein